MAQKVIPVSSLELQLFDPKIVNGMQTSTEIHLFFKKHKERLETETRSVLVRVIVPQSEESRDNIIYATNNQTPVSSSSLRVTEPVHYKIETYFKARGLYYDRRKNYYKNQGLDTKEKNSRTTEALKQQVDAENSTKGDKDRIEVVDLNVAKNRNGQQGKIPLMFTGKFQRFDNAPRPEDAQQGGYQKQPQQSGDRRLDVGFE